MIWTFSRLVCRWHRRRAHRSCSRLMGTLTYCGFDLEQTLVKGSWSSGASVPVEGAILAFRHGLETLHYSDRCCRLASGTRVDPVDRGQSDRNVQPTFFFHVNEVGTVFPSSCSCLSEQKLPPTCRPCNAYDPSHTLHLPRHDRTRIRQRRIEVC